MNRHVEGTISQADYKAGLSVAHYVLSLLDRLMPIQDGGIRIRLETGPQQLEQLETMEVGLDYAKGEVGPRFTCCCGYEPIDTADLVDHFRRHGASRLVVTPENRNGNRRR